MAPETTPVSTEAPVVGGAPAFLDMLARARHVAGTDRPAVVVGEPGSGKSFIAARLHAWSTRGDGPLVRFDCAAGTASCLEAGLFGQVPGDSTGSGKRRSGCLAQAAGGTLVLDEPAALPSTLQARVCDVLERGWFEPVGGGKRLELDARILATTSEDLPTAVSVGQLRGDLLDALAFEVLTLPPLRARHEDILPLAEHFAVRAAHAFGRDGFAGFSPAASDLLTGYTWPGNVRELKTVVERSVSRATADGLVDVIVLDPFASPFRPSGRVDGRSAATARGGASELQVPHTPGLPCKLKVEIARLEVDLVGRALARSHYKQPEAAASLGLSYHQLRALLRKHELVLARGRLTRRARSAAADDGPA